MKPFQELSQHIAQTFKNPFTNAIFFRHGQTNQNISNTIGGWTDSILTVKGRNQANQLFKGLHPHLNQFDGIYSSDLKRAKETARIALGFDKPFVEDRRLRETHFGKYENIAYSMLEKEIQDQIFNIDFKPPGGESYHETRNRAIEFLASLRENKTHLIFSHGRRQYAHQPTLLVERTQQVTVHVLDYNWIRVYQLKFYSNGIFLMKKKYEYQYQYKIFKFEMSVLNELDDLCDFTKVAQRWKQQQTKQSSSPTQSESNVSSTNPWNKENSIPSNIEEPKKMPNKVRSHAPQIIDEDTEQFKLRLEHLLNVFKTEATSEFMQMKRSMLDDQKQTIKSETERYLQMYEQKTAELAQTKEQLAETLKNNQIQIDRVDKITGLLGKLKSKQKVRKILQQLFTEFKKYSNNRKNKKKNSQRAIRHYQLTLQGHIWKLFIKAFNITIRDTIKERAKIQQQTDLDLLVMKFQKEQNLLESKLSEMAIQLDEANRVRNGMQENLKRAFMRGVCALNFEAMNVLQGNAQSLDIEQLSNNILTQNNETILLNESNQYQKQQSPIKNITFHAQNRLETNDHKWKDAPLVGYKQVPAVQVDNLKQLQDMSEQNSVVMSVSKLVQQDEDEFDYPVNEGKVIKVQIDQKTTKPKPKPQPVQQQTTKTMSKKK